MAQFDDKTVAQRIRGWCGIDWLWSLSSKHPFDSACKAHDDDFTAHEQGDESKSLWQSNMEFFRAIWRLARTASLKVQAVVFTFIVASVGWVFWYF